MLLEATVGGRVHEVEVQQHGQGYRVRIDGRTLEVDVAAADEDFTSLLVAGESHDLGLERQAGGLRVHFPAGSVLVELVEASGRGVAAVPRRPNGPARVTAQMPGRVVRVLVCTGASVEAGQGLVVVEAMKMENELRAPRPGRVEQVAVLEGQTVEAGALLVVVA